MTAHKASLFNAITLVVIGLCGAYAADFASPTAFIPVVFGAILLLLNGGVKKENKVIAHIAVVLTLLIILGLFKPLMSQIAQSDTIAIVRVGVMILSSIYALVYFIKSFRDARKARG